jgi:hypothetical protein
VSDHLAFWLYPDWGDGGTNMRDGAVPFWCRPPLIPTIDPMLSKCCHMLTDPEGCCSGCAPKYQPVPHAGTCMCVDCSAKRSFKRSVKRLMYVPDPDGGEGRMVYV